MPTLRRGVKGLRLARMMESERTGMHADVLAAYDRSLAQLASKGAEIVDMPKTTAFRELGQQVGNIISAEAYALVGDIADNNALAVDEAVRPRVRAGAAISSRMYLDTLAERTRLKQKFLADLDGIDAILTPTSMTPAIPVAEVDQSTSPAFTTRWVNFLDMCALALPNGFSADGLPTSLQIICRGGDEATALRIGWAWEQATDWQKRVPGIVERT